MDIWQITAAFEDGFNITQFSGLSNYFVHVGFDGAVLFKISIDDAFCFSARNLKVLCQTKSRLTVNDAKVDSFCSAALLTGHLINWCVKYFSRCGRMDVVAAFEGSNHIGVARKCSNDAQFYLRVIDGHELEVGRARYKSAANFSTFSRAYWNILKVGVIRA